MNPESFFGELKRRNVIRMAGLYLVGAWLVVQVAGTVLPMFGAPEWLPRTIVILLAIGFVPAVIFSWVFELTPEGLKREQDVAPEQSITPRTGRRMDRMIIVVLVLALGYLAFDKFVLTPRREAAVVASAVPNESKSLIDAKSIAVLPFQNLSEEKQNEYFADGIQDEILTDLARIADLKVISRTSVMQFKNKAALKLPEIAQALKVSHVLEGSVQRSGNRVRVSAQLIDARDDTHIWAEKYERDLADVFAIQSEIAQAIADHLQAKLSPKEKSAINERPTSDVAAYDLYLRAKELIYEGELSPSRQRENLLEAVQLLDQAVARDPAFLLAHCQLAGAHDLIYFFNYDHTPSRLNLAEASIANAVRLQPDAGQTHLAQAIHFYWGYRNYDTARAELTNAQQSLPNDAQVFKFLGLIDRRQGRWNEAVQNLERVVELDPRNVDSFGNLAQAYFDLRRYNESIAMFDRIAQLEPGNPALRTYRASIELSGRGDVAPLRAVINTIEAEGPASAADVVTLSFELALYERDPAAAARALANLPREGLTDPSSFPFPHAWFEGLLAELRQDMPSAQSAFMVARSETEKIVRGQTKNEKALSILALIDAHLGQKDKAIQEGRTACGILPITKDAVDGVTLISNLAKIYAITGERDLALQQLEIATKLPSGLTYGELRLAPEWDSLRSDPRFQQIVNSLAPKESAAAAK
jgi:TolB-like protein/Tfp pilus assembly protein PilF